MSFGLQFLIVVVFLGVVGTALMMASVLVIREYERGVVLTFGRYAGTRQPGVRFILPVIQQIERVDIREKVVDVQPQDIITKDNILVKVNGVVYYRICNPRLAILDVEDYSASTREMAQSILRNSAGGHDLDELSDPQRLGDEIKKVLEIKTEPWGIKVSNVEIKEIEVDQNMARAISRQAEAERHRRAMVIEANGEEQAAQSLSNAARIISESPGAMQLRYLTALGNLANERTSTIVFPFPTDIGQMLGSTDISKLPSEVVQLLNTVTKAA